MYWMNKCCCQILEITFLLYFIFLLRIKKGDFAESFYALHATVIFGSVITEWIIIQTIFKLTYVYIPIDTKR